MSPVTPTLVSAIGLAVLLVAWLVPADPLGGPYLIPDQPGEVWSVSYLGLTLRFLGILGGISFGVGLLWRKQQLRALGAGFLIGLGIPFFVYTLASALYVATSPDLKPFPADYVRPASGLVIAIGALASIRVRGATESTSARGVRRNAYLAPLALTLVGTVLAALAVWWEGVEVAYHWFHLEFVAVAICIIVAIRLMPSGRESLARGLVIGAGVALVLRVPTEVDAAIGFPDPIAAAAAIVLVLAGGFAVSAGLRRSLGKRLA